MLGGIKRRVWTVALVAGVVLAAAGTAFAGANTLHVKVPRAKVDTSYTITVKGTAAGSKHLYLFIDSKKCGSSPAVEYGRTGHYGTAYGYYWKSVKGSFTRSAGFKTTAPITDHACAYLAKASARKNGARGVIRHSYKTYRVRS